MDGLQGLIIIEDPDDPSEQALKEMYDEERVLFLQDWYHKSGSSLRNSKHDIYIYIYYYDDDIIYFFLTWSLFSFPFDQPLTPTLGSAFLRVF